MSLTVFDQCDESVSSIGRGSIAGVAHRDVSLCHYAFYIVVDAGVYRSANEVLVLCGGHSVEI